MNQPIEQTADPLAREQQLRSDFNRLLDLANRMADDLGEYVESAWQSGSPQVVTQRLLNEFARSGWRR